MRKTNSWLRKVWLAAGFSVMAMSAHAFMIDPTITVDRALNSPTLTIRYSGAAAAFIELRVNGTSLGTRTVSTAKQNGEANFTLDMSALTEGKNDIQVLLLDKTGHIIGSEKTSITAGGAPNTPVTLTAPKMGATVRGPVDISVGFGKDMRNSYVSFFVNNQFKAMTNYPPYSYTWDTTRETNGWHEVEAWLVDENSSTFKTRKIRVFVDNAGGHTARQNVDPVVPALVKPGVVKPLALAHVSPKTIAVGVVRANALNLALAPTAGTKPAPLSHGVATGTRASAPTAKSALTSPVKTTAAKAVVAKPVIEVHPAIARVVPPVTSVTRAASMLRITHGFRTMDRKLNISFNAQQIDFDVQPRVLNNVPLTPFRHLIEKAGGKVKWQNKAKTVDAIADGRSIFLKIGNSQAMVNHSPVTLEVAPFIEKSRTIVPLSFIETSLNVNVDYDPVTGHVLITNKKKN